MTQLSLDMPSLLMVLSFTINMIVALFDPTEIPISKEIGAAILACGALFFVYVLYYLRSGFFGETEPKLDFLITAGPYGFCRHPLYLSFIIIMFGIDLMSRGIAGVIFTLIVTIPAVIYRARAEDELLRNKFGKEWDDYAARVGFLLPRFGVQSSANGGNA